MSENRRKIMIVDDNVTNLTMGRNLLKAHYEVYLAPSADQMFVMLSTVTPDLILLDIEMPETDGYEAICRLKAHPDFAGIPVIFLTAQNNEESEIKGFDLGAADYISKPFSPPLLLKRIEHQLLIVWQKETIQTHTNNLSMLVSEKIGEIASLQNAILGTVADLVEFRDKFTGGHIARTQLYLKEMLDGLQRTLSYKDRISGWDIEYVLQSAQLHDMGKIAIPDAILNKPGRLTADEFAVMKTHVTVGIDAVNRIIDKTKEGTFLRHARNIVGAHHERWDGSGYPYGLKGEEIPFEGRLMAIADVYDALVSWRPYKERISHDKAKSIIQEGRGTHFDPILVDVFLGVEKKFQQISAKAEQEGFLRWNLISFTPKMDTGIPIIDAQHRELIVRLNNLISLSIRSVSEEEVRATLAFFAEYAIQHFGEEELLQRQSDYPKYQWHRAQHQGFIAEFQRLQQTLMEHGFSLKLLSELSTSATDWVVHHIQSVDVEFGKYYRLQKGMLSAL